MYFGPMVGNNGQKILKNWNLKLLQVYTSNVIFESDVVNFLENQIHPNPSHPTPMYRDRNPRQDWQLIINRLYWQVWFLEPYYAYFADTNRKCNKSCNGYGYIEDPSDTSTKFKCHCSGNNWIVHRWHARTIWVVGSESVLNQ